MSANGEGDKSNEGRTSNATIHIEKITRGEGDGAEVKYNVAKDGRTFLREGTLEAAVQRLREILEDEMD